MVIRAPVGASAGCSTVFSQAAGFELAVADNVDRALIQLLRSPRDVLLVHGDRSLGERLSTVSRLASASRTPVVMCIDGPADPLERQALMEAGLQNLVEVPEGFGESLDANGIYALRRAVRSAANAVGRGRDPRGRAVSAPAEARGDDRLVVPDAVRAIARQPGFRDTRGPSTHGPRRPPTGHPATTPGPSSRSASDARPRPATGATTVPPPRTVPPPSTTPPRGLAQRRTVPPSRPSGPGTRPPSPRTSPPVSAERPVGATVPPLPRGWAHPGSRPPAHAPSPGPRTRPPAVSPSHDGARGLAPAEPAPAPPANPAITRSPFLGRSQGLPAPPASTGAGSGVVAPSRRLLPLAATEEAPRRSSPTRAARLLDGLRPGAVDPGVELIVIGSSTGGPGVLTQLFSLLPTDVPPIVIAQHLLEGFSASLALQLDAVGRLVVREGFQGAPLACGVAYVAPSGLHARVMRARGGLALSLGPGAPDERHCPSVDALFFSAAEVVGPRAIGLIMTGMGSDGADGLLAMRRAGAATLAQDEASSAVFGMAARAIERGAASLVASPVELAAVLAETTCDRYRVSRR